MPTTLKLPIVNVYAKGDYCATLHIGSEKSPVNLIIDSGSSTLVVKETSYQASKDKDLTPTTIAQEVNYGIGGWNGPVIHSTVTINNEATNNENPEQSLHHDKQSITLENATIALVSSEKQYATFGMADGMLGMAYHHLNKGFNLSEYLAEQSVAPAHTYPWPFSKNSKQDSENLSDFKHFLWQYPEHNITPYFTELALHNLSTNKFSFYSKRSAIHINENHTPESTSQELKQDPLNQGWLIFGGGEEQTDLYQGNFESIKVEHDVYYNVELVSVQVGKQTPIAAAPLDKKNLKNYFTNAIIDTGAGGIVLTAEIYQQVISDLIAVNREFTTLLSPFKDYSAQEVGIDASALNLAHWPDITFTFVGDIINNVKQPIHLKCSPHTYWQVNTPSYGKACFRLLSQLPQWPNQSIIGLPLLNNYYVVFDRSENKTGVIKFAHQNG